LRQPFQYKWRRSESTGASPMLRQRMIAVAVSVRVP
jgi:hypothetical protein